MPTHSSKRMAAFAGIVLAACGMVYFGARWMKRSQVEQQLVTAIRNPNRMERLHALAGLRDSNLLAAEQAAMGLLSSDDKGLREGATNFLMLAHPPLGEPMPVSVSDRLANQLRTDTDPRVRLTCAIALMGVYTPVVREAFIVSLRDSFDKVVQISCVEVGHRGGPGAKEGLAALLNHPSWHIRLETCKGMIVGKFADEKTVATLEQMSGEPDAATYDAQIDEFDKIDREAHASLGHRWGKIGTILDEAKKMAAEHNSSGKA